MITILELQKLAPTTSTENNVLLMSTASGICPTTAAAGEFNQFEME